MQKEVIVEVKQMNKRFGSTVALDDVDITINRGEIVGLIGENGSGKSTVTSIISGMQTADSGQMTFIGNVWKPESMLDALNNGIGMIVQETGTVPGISVAENIFLGESDQFRKFENAKGKRYGFISKKKMNKAAKIALENIGANDIDPRTITGMLDLQTRKLIEIARIYNRNPELLVVDETTTALSQNGREMTYKIMEDMKQNNKAVIFISHDLDEIINVCDTLTVLRDGKIITTFEREDFDEDKIKSSMIGRELKGDYYRSDFDGSFDEQVVLEATNLHLGTQLKDVSIQLHKGEILGIGGLSHCGMHELCKVLYGNVKQTSGSVKVNGDVLKDEADAMAHKVGYVAKDRDTESLCLDASIKDNIAIAGLEKFATFNRIILPNKEKEYVQTQIDALSIKCNNMNQYVSSLSGGNKQKVVFGKWIGRESEILILDCPTRGVDIGVKQAMYQLMYQMKQEGRSILIVSEEMTELIGMSDRILVMKDGVIAKEIQRSEELSESDIIHYMI